MPCGVQTPYPAPSTPQEPIKAGVCARGANVGVPMRPGNSIGLEDRGRIERFAAEIERAEESVAQELSLRKFKA